MRILKFHHLVDDLDPGTTIIIHARVGESQPVSILSPKLAEEALQH
jgi:hypothetical protein